jgi:hypothetical protein
MDNELKTYLEAMERRIVTLVGDRMRQFESSLQDGMIVTNGMVDRHSYTLQEHEQWLRDHTRAMAQHRDWIQQHEAAMHEHEAMMHELDRKLDRIAELILKGRGSNGGSPETEDR